MKKILFVLASFILLPATIISTSSAGIHRRLVTGTITATVDGVEQSFNVSKNVTVTSAAGVHGVSIIGLENATGYGISIVISAADGEIRPRRYVSNANKYEVAITYSHVVNGLTYGNTAFNNEAAAGVEIIAISASNIKGTFDGTLKQTGNSQATKTITNGRFDLNIE